MTAKYSLLVVFVFKELKKQNLVNMNRASAPIYYNKSSLFVSVTYVFISEQ